jgi:hypothetical protein
MANEPQTNTSSFWDSVESHSIASGAPVSPDTSSDPSASIPVSHGFWDRVEGKKPAAGGNVVSIGGQPVDLKTGVGAQQASISQAGQAGASQIKNPEGHLTSDPNSVSPITRAGYGMPGNLLPDVGTPERAAGTKMATVMAGSMPRYLRRPAPSAISRPTRKPYRREKRQAKPHKQLVADSQP